MVMLETVQKQIADGTYAMTNKTLTSPILTTPLVDTINEQTAANGVTVDGVKCKDGSVFTNSGNVYSVTAFNLDDDTAISWTPTSGFGIVIFNSRSSSSAAVNGMATYRCPATSYMGAMVTGTNVVWTTGALSGTTGTDGKLTLSAHTDGKIYMENRLGATRSYSIIFLGN